MADLELTKQNIFDYKLSGTTCNIVFQFNNHLVCLSVGDSRGILVFEFFGSSFLRDKTIYCTKTFMS